MSCISMSDSCVSKLVCAGCKTAGYGAGLVYGSLKGAAGDLTQVSYPVVCRAVIHHHVLAIQMAKYQVEAMFSQSVACLQGQQT